MRVAIMQPYFYPYIGYFQLINSAETFVIYDDVHYIQRGWINRNYILSVNGRTLITIPIVNKSINKINDTEISCQYNWREKILRSIFLEYKKAPNFDIVFPLIEEAINCQSKYISDIAICSIKSVINYLGITTNILKSSDLEHHNEGRLEKINEILCLTRATDFILPPGSVELYFKKDFIVPTYYLMPDKDIKYRQFDKARFESSLSVIDIMMFNGKEEIQDLLNRYSLI